MSSRASCLEQNEVRVWYARTHEAWADYDTRHTALEWLQPSERARYDRFRHDTDRAMFLLGRVMARALVGRAIGVAPSAWPWCDSPGGRPTVGVAPCPVSFNLAHSGGLVACALTRQGDVGVDVEDRARPVLDRQLVTRFCSPAEQKAIDAAGPAGWRDAFLRYWTLKEAYLKARGLGITVALADLSFSLNDDTIVLTPIRSLTGTDARWTFHLRDIDGTHFLAVAAPAPDAGVTPRVIVDPFPHAWLPSTP